MAAVARVTVASRQWRVILKCCTSCWVAAYSLLRSAGMMAVTALLLSGVLPALGVTISAIRNRRLDVVGALVLAGIAVGAVSHSTRLLLVQGSVPRPSLAWRAWAHCGHGAR